MAEVSSPNPAATYHDGKGNKILSLTEVKTIMVRYTDPDGKESMALVYVFGESMYGKEKLAGVWVVANLQQLQSQLRLAGTALAKSIIAMMEERGLMSAGKVVSGTASTIEAELPDVADVFSEIQRESTTPVAPKTPKKRS